MGEKSMTEWYDVGQNETVTVTIPKLISSKI